MASPEVLALVDHLVYGTADLDRGISEVERVRRYAIARSLFKPTTLGKVESFSDEYSAIG
jgi:hypothetical protein